MQLDRPRDLSAEPAVLSSVVDVSGELSVDIAALRDAAGTADGLAAGMSGGLSAEPAQVAVPRWATVDAAGAATETVRHHLLTASADLAATARQIVAAILDYEAADERAAIRLRSAA